jgi:intron-binding protein aquarius
MVDFKGKGEFCPSPFSYQNLGEAEYVVAVYQFMRLIGYPADRISILTTYNGQRNLIREILGQRCRNSVFGKKLILYHLMHNIF